MTIPTHITFFSDIETPVSLFNKISQAEPTAFLLESSDGDNRLARYSFIGVSPVKTVRFKDGVAYLYDCLNDLETQIRFENPLQVLRQEQERFLAEMPVKIHPDPAYPFLGGWVGYMGYAATQYFERIPQQTEDVHQVPDGYFGLYDSVILYDHLFRRITFLSYRAPQEAEALWNRLEKSLLSGPALTPLFYNNDLPDSAIFDGVTGPFTQDSFCDRVLQAKEYIRQGQVFQIVLSQRFSLPVSCPPLDIYRTLQAINPSPYSYYLKFPSFTYLGSSPETFVQSHNGKVTLRALAGTRPRGASEEEDIRFAEELRANEKELAEHYMLVDLGRNDLGRICEVGTIQVGDIAELTRYSHVMHLATELSGRLRPDKTVYDVFQSCFPRGTVSGAPKVRAMHLLAELEPERRGVYSGAVGYFDNFGNMDAAIAIRSALIHNGMAHVNAGAGVVYDSDPEAEYQETRNKAKSILKAIQIAERMERYADCTVG